MAFNLSKNNDPVPAHKKNGWVFILLAVVVLGGAIWYFIPKKEEVRIEAATPLATPVPTPVRDTVVATEITSSPAPATSRDTNVTTEIPAGPASALVAASFNKGTSAPLSISDEVVSRIRQSQKIIIYGYASSEGELSVNLKLAQERAESFKRYLVSKGVDASMITAVGKGIDNPIASNDTETGRIRNRRVEVSIE